MRSRARDLRDGLVEGDARERGVVLAFLAMILFTLIVMAGLAVDVGNWWWTGQKVQKAADAAAMAGVTYMPEDVSATGSLAKSMARTISSRNGYTNGSNTNVAVAGSSRPTELRVTIDTDVTNYFTGILGFKTTNIKRTAVADYAGSVPMGSPSDFLGQDPETAGRLQKLWLNVSGRASTKGSGDRFTSRTCGTSTFACSGDNTDSDHNGNNEYLFDNAATSNNGYRFVIRVDSVTGNPLKVQAYDPAFIFTGDYCGSNMPTQLQANTLQSTYANVAPYGTFFNDAAVRYSPTGNDWCPGDQNITFANLNTAYILRAPPDDTPWTDLDNPVVCTKTFRPIDTSLFKYLDPANPSWNPADPTYADGQYVRANFHRWVDICTVASGSVSVGDYVLQIRTNFSDMLNPQNTDLSVDTGGHNRFSLRTGFDTGVGIPTSTAVNIFANGKLPMYVNAGSTSAPTFYLARILPTAAGRTLRLEFFDIGDVGSGSVSMQVLPPPEYASTFSNCTFKRDNASAGTSSTCTLTGMTSADYNGRLVTLTIPIPAGYTCTIASKTGCWVRIQMTFSGGATPADTTTWSASIDGDPIRLVE